MKLEVVKVKRRYKGSPTPIRSSPAAPGYRYTMYMYHKKNNPNIKYKFCVIILAPGSWSSHLDLTQNFYIVLAKKKRLKMDRFKSLQLVGKNSSNLPNKCIYMGMVCRYSVKGATTLVHRFTGKCSLIAHFNKYSMAVPLRWQTK